MSLKINKDVLTRIIASLSISDQEPNINEIKTFSGESDHTTLKITYTIGDKINSVFLKVYNRHDSFFDNNSLSESEARAITEAEKLNVPAARILVNDIKGTYLGAPLLVFTVINGMNIEEVINTKPPSEKRDYAIELLPEILSIVESLRKVKSTFGPISKPSWIRDANSFTDFFKRGMYREFWRMGLLDERYIFKSSWAKNVFEWSIKDSDLMNKLQSGLCHGDLVCKNIFVSPEKRINGVVDWEYAYWGPVEKDMGDYIASILYYLNIKDIPSFLTTQSFRNYNLRLVSHMVCHRLLILYNSKTDAPSKIEKEIILQKINYMVSSF